MCMRACVTVRGCVSRTLHAVTKDVSCEYEHDSATDRCPGCVTWWRAVDLSGRMPDSREPGLESPLLPFQSFGIFVLHDAPVHTDV